MPRVLSRTGRSLSFGSKLPRSEHVPSLPFFPTSTVYSARHPAGLLHPASGHGVRHVSGLLPVRCPKARGGRLAFPGGATPFGAFPFATGRHASPRADSLSSLFLASGLESARVATFGLGALPRSLDLRALLRSEVRCEPAGVAAGGLPDAPLGLVPGGFVNAVNPATVPKSGGRLAPLRSEDRAGTGQGFRVLPRLARGRVDLASGVWPDWLGPEGSYREGLAASPKRSGATFDLLPGREAFVPARLRSEDRRRLGASGSGRFGSPCPRVRPSEEGFLCGFGQPRCRFPSADRRSRVPKGAVIPFRGLHGPPEGGSLARQTAGGAPHGVPVQAWALLPFPKEGLLGRGPVPLASGFRRAPRPLARGEVQTRRHRTSSTCDASFRGPEGPVGRSLRLFRADARVLVSGTEVSEFPMSPKRRRDALPGGERRGSSPGRRRNAEVTNRSSQPSWLLDPKVCQPRPLAARLTSAAEAVLVGRAIPCGVGRSPPRWGMR